MFKLTKPEQKVVAFLVGMLLLGNAVRYWRAQHPPTKVSSMETKGY